MKKHSLFLTAVLAFLLCLSACGQKKSAETSAQPQTPSTVENDETENVSPEAEPPVEEIAPEDTIPEALRDQKHILRFDKNGEMRILMISDVQASAPAPSQRALDAIEIIVEREQPDLVLFGGDNSLGCSSEEILKNYVEKMVAPMEARQIPWAHVYGNHDDEGKAMTRAQQQKVYESFDYCVSKAGPEDIKGVGNYVLPVYSSEESRTDPVFAVWGLDSGSYVTDKGLAGSRAVLEDTMFRGHPGSGYAYMPFSQIQWYYNTSEEIEEYAGHKVPGMMYFHIPLQEFYEVVLNPEQTGMTGVQRDPICAGPLNSGMFTAILERGDIRAVSCGHDHINDYSGEFCGVKLCYASTLGYDTYHDEDIMGARMFIIQEENPYEIETYISYVSGIDPHTILSSEGLIVDFEDASAYTLADGATIADGVLKIASDGTVTTAQPFKINNGRYLRMHVDTTGGTLTSVALRTHNGDEYAASVAAVNLYYRADGTDEWLSLSEGETLPAGFAGQIALSASSMKKGADTPTKETAVAGLHITADGSVSVDNVEMVSSYKK